MDGISSAQVQYLYAPTHLNPTYEYGVSFERATCVKYGDRRQVFISGTASINNKGEVVYPGDIRLQTHRMWENVEVLPQPDVHLTIWHKMIVYLRDTADYQIVKQLFDERFPQIPKVICSHQSAVRDGSLKWSASLQKQTGTKRSQTTDEN